jgi:hypothetical protein
MEGDWEAIQTYFKRGPVIRLKKVRKTTEDTQSVQTVSMPWLKPGTSQMQLTTITAYTNLLANFHMLLCVVMRNSDSLQLKNTKGERDIWASKIRRHKDWRKLHNVELHNFCVSRLMLRIL